VNGVSLSFMSSPQNKMLSQDISVLLNYECCVINHNSAITTRMIARYPLYPLDATIHSTRYFQ